MNTIYSYINSFIESLFTPEAIVIYQNYINDISFILTILWVIIIAVLPVVLVWNIGSAIMYTLKPQKETRGSKKRRTN